MSHTPDLQLRVRTALAHGWHTTRQHLTGTWQWVQDQPRSRVLTLLGAGLAVLPAVLSLGWLLSLLTALLGWLFTSSETPPPPAPAPAPPAPSTPNPLVIDLTQVSLWGRLWHAVDGYAHQQAAAAGMAPWLLLAIWGAVGLMVLLAAWGWRRSGIGTLAWWGWLAATAVVVFQHTPGHSPSPAVLVAALGVAISVLPWTVLPITGLVLAGVLA